MKLRDYQLNIANKASELLHTDKIAYLSMECRTGKTLTALHTASTFGANSVLFITKLKAIQSIRDDYKKLKPRYSLDIINYESVKKAGGVYDLVIIDEAHSLGAFPKPGSRTKIVKEKCKDLPIIYLSGTPTPESFSQLYHQFWVSSFSPWKEYTNFYKWAKEYVSVTERRINGFMVRDYRNANKGKIDEDAKHLFIDYSQTDAGFETNIHEEILEVPMRPQIMDYIYSLSHDKVVEINGHTILGDTPVKCMGKAHQISSGTVIDEEGNHLIIDSSKADYIKCRFKGQKIAIFYIYQSELELLRKVFPNNTNSPEEFQKSKDLVFIAQVRSAREGVRLDTADALIFFNMEYSYLSYEQGRNRLVSKDRKRMCNVYFLVSDCGIEKDIMNAVMSKQDYNYVWFKSKMKNVGIRKQNTIADNQEVHLGGLFSC